MMLLIMAFVLAVLIVVAFSEEEGLEDMRDRAWVNRLADESKRRKHGRAHKYSRAGI